MGNPWWWCHVWTDGGTLRTGCLVKPAGSIILGQGRSNSLGGLLDGGGDHAQAWADGEEDAQMFTEIVSQRTCKMENDFVAGRHQTEWSLLENGSDVTAHSTVKARCCSFENLQNRMRFTVVKGKSSAERGPSRCRYSSNNDG
ncbi:hypothetical protein ACJRO7_014151 [Eucalyptus globulus]|uniref:Uncharacterized protein n=1 Tax=Eucalyptus globulus TaxID=34317 RepID=A0ABD3L552_EUCGL